MLMMLKWFVRWYRRRAIKTKILIALVIVATFLGCYGYLTPAHGPSGPASTPKAIGWPAAAVLYTGSGEL